MEIADLQLRPDCSREAHPLYAHLCELIGTLDGLSWLAPRESQERRVFDRLANELGRLADFSFPRIAEPLQDYLGECERRAAAARMDKATSGAIYEWLCWYLGCCILHQLPAIEQSQEGWEKASAVLALLPSHMK